MKKTAALILAIAMILALGACGKAAAKEPDFDGVCQRVSEAVPGVSSMTAADEDFIAGSLGVAIGSYTDAMVMVTSTGTAIDEFGVIKCADAKAAESVKTAIEAYIKQRIDTWMGYTPEELPKLENAEVETEGSFVFYGILGDSDLAAAGSAFDGCFIEG